MLEPIGLGPEEERVYNILVDRGRIELDDLARAAELENGHAALVANTLVERGLARRAAGPAHEYLLAPPEPAIEALVAQRLEQLQRVRALASDLAERSRRARPVVDPARLVEVVSGEGAIRQVFLQFLHAAQLELATFDRPPYALEDEEVDPIQAERIASQGVVFRTVFDSALMEDPAQVARILRGVDEGEKARLGEVPLKMSIVDREVAVLPLLHEGEETPEAVVLVRQSVLLESLVALFEAVWSTAIEVKRGDLVASSSASDPTERRNRELLRLLSTGMTDAAMARQLGVSERTVRRRIKGLLDTLGVHTRFQAAVRAVERGWL